MKKTTLIGITLITAIAISGCQKNPDSSIVVNKNMDKLIEQANDNKDDEAVEEMAEKYNTYKKELEDEQLHVKVSVDAKVDIPKTDKMSIIRVKQKNISQDLLDKVKNALLADKTLYDGGATSVRTKTEIEDEISMYQENINSTRDESEYSEDEKNMLIEEYQSSIDDLQIEYNNAPSSMDIKQVVSDGKIHKIEDKVSEGTFDYYNYQKEFDPNGEVFYGVTDASDGWYESLYVQNNENYSNCIRYSKASKGYPRESKIVTVDETNINAGSSTVWGVDEDIPQTVLSGVTGIDGNPIIPECENEKVNITEKDAQKQAEELLEKIGVKDFMCNEKGLFCERYDIDNMIYRKVYIFKYVRTINGVMLENGGEKFGESGSEQTYTKKLWPREVIEIKVNDNGIVDFRYNAPLEITETVVDNSKMQSFDSIKKTFEKMVTVVNASEYNPVKLKVDRVKLRYERISEKDSFDTGLLIPSWDFWGAQDDDISAKENNGEVEKSILTINAIDGSIINRELGY